MILQTTILPPQASEMAWHVDNLIWFIAGTTIIASLGVYAALFYFCVAFREKPGNTGQTPRILGSHKLELLWTVIPLLIFLVMFGWGAWVYNMALHAPDDAPELYIVGKQWMWKIQYPGGQRVILAANNLEHEKDIGGQGYFEGTLVLPINRPVKVITTSEDVIHNFGIPAFRQKMDVVPGRYTSTWYQPNKLGEFQVFCNQYCGTNHSLMIGKILVVEQADYEAWLEGRWKTGPGKNAVDGSLAHQGRQLFMKLNCIQCHGAEGSLNQSGNRAPNLEEIFKSRRPLKGGTTVTADEDYLRESIRKPRAKIREGWEPIMPAFGPDKVSEEDLIKVIAYIKSLRKGETPVRTEDWVAPVGGPTESTPTEGGSQR